MSTPSRPWRRVLAAAAAAACVAAGIAGCASPYGEATLFGGYRSEKLDSSHWRVQYDGNGNTPREQVWAYWIYRCAEVTKQNGYTVFAMLPSVWTPPPMPAASAAPAAWNASPRDGWRARPAVWRVGDDPGRTQVRSGGGYIVTYVPGYTTSSWHTKGVVAMFNAPVDPDAWLVLDAKSVLDDLGPYVRGEVKHPIDRELLVRHGLRWVDDHGAVLPLMAPPTAASAPAAPVRFAPRSTRQGGLAS